MEQALRHISKRIDAADVVSLLREVYPEGVKGRNEAEALIVFDREFSNPASEWRGFMAEAIADHLVRRSEPLGIVTEEKADWLIAAIAPTGRIATRGGIEALLRSMELAGECPASLAAFAIRELTVEIIAGEGPALDGRQHLSRMLDADDVILLRRMLLAASRAAVSAEEAEALFDLHDAVAASDNHDSFDDLFFRAIANYLLGASGIEARTREDALSHELRRDAGSSIASECCVWLSSRIMRDGRPTAAERALLALIGNGKEPDPSLRRLLDHAA